MSHVDARGLTPLSDDVTSVHDESRLVAAFFDGTDRIAERLAAERLIVIERKIARIFHFCGDRMVDCSLQPRLIDAGFVRRLALPGSIRKITRLRAGRS